MKKLTLSFALLLGSLQAYSQTVITGSDVDITITTNVEIMTDSVVTLPTPGANQVWDYNFLNTAASSSGFVPGYDAVTSSISGFPNATLRGDGSISLGAVVVPSNFYLAIDQGGLYSFGSKVPSFKLPLNGPGLPGSAGDTLEVLARDSYFLDINGNPTPQFIRKFPITEGFFNRQTTQLVNEFKLTLAVAGYNNADVEAVQTYEISDTVMGYGTMLINNSSYSAIYIKETEIETSNYTANGNPIPAPLLAALGLVEGSKDTTERHIIYSPDLKTNLFRSIIENGVVAQTYYNTALPQPDIAPAATMALQLTKLGTYYTGSFDESATEISAFDPASNRLYVTNGFTGDVDIIDISNPALPVAVDTIDLAAYGAAANSVAFKNGLLAVAVEANVKQNPGKVVFFNANGVYQNDFTVGALPDMLTFSPDGQKVVVANEGEPSDDFTNDPEGSISVIDLSNGIASATVTTIGLTAFNVGGPRHNEIAAAIGSTMKIAGPAGTSVAQSLEPEYVTISNDNNTAYVACQEANALVIVNLTTNTITSILPLGYKDHLLAGNGLDATDRNDSINISNWPVRGLYQPDAITSYMIGGQTYLVSANEGDAMNYSAFSEEERIKDLTLDSATFPNADRLQDDLAMGRLRITNAMGDADNDGDYDTLYSYGTRSFTIWNATTGAVVWDSGDDFEQITAAMMPDNFNASNDENDYKARSDDKGPEPEAVAVHNINGKWYAFVGLERVGGIMVYDISTPTAPVFVDYIMNRDFSITPSAATVNTVGDLGPEGILILADSISPNGQTMMIVTNEVSGTVTMYSVQDATAGIADKTNQVSFSMMAYPNPATDQVTVLLDKVTGFASLTMYDMQGRQVSSQLTAANSQAVINTSDLPTGLYLLQVQANGQRLVQKIMVK